MNWKKVPIWLYAGISSTLFFLLSVISQLYLKSLGPFHRLPEFVTGPINLLEYPFVQFAKLLVNVFGMQPILTPLIWILRFMWWFMLGALIGLLIQKVRKLK